MRTLNRWTLTLQPLKIRIQIQIYGACGQLQTTKGAGCLGVNGLLVHKLWTHNQTLNPASTSRQTLNPTNPHEKILNPKP